MNNNNLTLIIKHYQKEGRLEEIHILIEDTGEIISIDWGLDTIDYEEFYRILNTLGMTHALHIINKYYVFDNYITNTYVEAKFN